MTGEITGNEALLEMLETDAAIEMLNWGKSTATSVVKQTENLDDIAATLEGRAVIDVFGAQGNMQIPLNGSGCAIDCCSTSP